MSRQYRSGCSQGWHVGSQIDPARVYRASGGERLPLTTAERREAVRRLVFGERLSSNEAARRLGVAWRTVQRHRAAIGREAA
jgi:predicted DNA-binding protein (UPF0251 family)